MRKRHDNYLDTEAMKLGLKQMLLDVETELQSGIHSDAIKAVLSDRKVHIITRLEEMK